MLKEKLQADVKEALKSHNQQVVDVLRMALSSVSAKEKEKRYKIAKEKPDTSEAELLKQSALLDDEVISVVSSEIKKRKDAMALYQQGNRQELVDQEAKEIKILQIYLPEQLSKEALDQLVQESVNNVGATTIKDMGKVMADLMPKVKGRADNGQISIIIKTLLQ